MNSNGLTEMSFPSTNDSASMSTDLGGPGLIFTENFPLVGSSNLISTFSIVANADANEKSDNKIKPSFILVFLLIDQISQKVFDSLNLTDGCEEL